jgi:hypothetical protein
MPGESHGSGRIRKGIRCGMFQLSRGYKQQHTHTIVTDFCQYNKPWRKRTRLLRGNLDTQDLQRWQRTCIGNTGICTRTHKPHFQLTGSDKQSIPWTRVAMPYPDRLCHDLAFVLTAHKQYSVICCAAVLLCLLLAVGVLFFVGLLCLLFVLFLVV